MRLVQDVVILNEIEEGKSLVGNALLASDVDLDLWAQASERIHDPLARLMNAIAGYCESTARQATSNCFVDGSAFPLAARSDEAEGGEKTPRVYLVDAVKACIDANYIFGINAIVLSNQIALMIDGWDLRNWVLKSMIARERYIAIGLDIFLSGFLTIDGLKQLAQMRNAELTFVSHDK